MVNTLSKAIMTSDFNMRNYKRSVTIAPAKNNSTLVLHSFGRLLKRTQIMNLAML